MAKIKDSSDQDNPYSELVAELKQRENLPLSPISKTFVAFISLLAIIFIALGFYQLQQHSQILAKDEYNLLQMQQDPISLPPQNEWKIFDANIYSFRPIIIVGKYLAQKPVCVVTNLDNSKDSDKGCWVIAPFELESGGIILVNRGFVKQADMFLINSAPSPLGAFTLKGIARTSQQSGLFTKGPDIKNRVDYVLSVKRLAIFMKLNDENIAPIYMDIAADQETSFQGGETQVKTLNRHFEYAMVSFLISLTIILLSFYWLLKKSIQKRKSRLKK